MTPAERRSVAHRRLAALGLTRPLPDRTPLGTVRHLGALQAQDLTSGLWSLGARTGGTVAEVLGSVARGEITRTWVMRGTLHWVAAEDAEWMCRLLAGPAMRKAALVLAREGITEEILERAGDGWAQHLAQVPQMTRAEAAAVLSRNGIDPSGQRCYHLLVRHSQRGLLVQGPIVRTPTGALEPTFVCRDAWVARPRRPGRQEAMALLAQRYVASHGPVTETDFAVWCDQPLRFAREAVALTDGRVGTETVGGTAYLVSADAPEPEAQSGSAVLLLAGFDEWLLGYRDRSVQLTPQQHQLVAPGGNGVFRGTVFDGGALVATWRRGTGGSGLLVQVQPEGPVSQRVRRGVERAAAAYGRFWDRPVQVRWPDG